ncbi:MAG: discoidin domain-containing protein [Nanoarchaeota archaeon]
MEWIFRIFFGCFIVLFVASLTFYQQVSSLTVSASSNDGNLPQNTLDLNLSTRWSALGRGQWIRYDLGNLSYISDVSIAFYQGNIRRQNFTISVSVNGSTWQKVYSNLSSGNTSSLENYKVNKTARYLKITGYMNNVNDWNSITETRINFTQNYSIPSNSTNGSTMNQLDTFGIKKIYNTSQNGNEWFSTWHNGVSRIFSDVDPQDQWFDADHGNANYNVDGRGLLKITGSVPRMYIHDPLLNRSWRNVEMTVYAMRVNDTNINWGGIVGMARTNHGTTAPELQNLCDTRGIAARMRYDGRVDFEKETKHPSSQVVLSQVKWSNGFPKNIWIGYKYVVYDLPNGNVKLELYLDETNGLNGGNWIKIREFEDTGNNFGTNGQACASGVNPGMKLTGSNSRAGSESGKPNIAVYWRSDGVNTNGLIYKKMSVREI